MTLNIKNEIAKAKKSAAEFDGHREVALAIAGTSKGLTVEGKGEEWRKGFNAISGKAFSVDSIGIKDRKGMGTFKQNLARLMPGLESEVAQIPESPTLTPADVARYVSAIKKQVIRAKDKPQMAVPSFFVRGETTEARKRIENSLGKQFAEKSSDRLVSTLDLRFRASRESFVPAAQALVLEFASAELTPVATASREEVGDPHLAQMIWEGLRKQSIDSYRDFFSKQITAMRSELIKGASRESFESMQSDLCWLNNSMRTLSTPKAIADVAGDKALTRIGLPRLIARECSVTAKTVGALAFRKATTFAGKDIVVAVIDGEVDANHPGLKGRILHKTNFTHQAWGTPDDHGTAVAGIIAGFDKKFTGMAPAVTIASYKIFPTNAQPVASDFDATVAIQRVLEDGVRIANCSWGVGPAGDGTSREAKAFDRAWQLGLLIVKSAGNAGPGPRTATSPADAAGVIVVAATDRKGKAVQDYSSRGPIGTKAGPDLAAPGGAFTDPMNALTPGGGTGQVGVGTSFAAPHVAGLAALLLSQNPHDKPDDIRAKLYAKCGLLPGLAADAQGRGFLKL